MKADLFDPSEVRRAKYTIFLNAACCAGWCAINAVGAWLLAAPRLLGLSAAAVAMMISWTFALRDLRRGFVIRGVLNYVASGLLLLLAMSLSVPEMSLLFVFATFIFLAFGLAYADRAASRWIVALTLTVAATMLVTSLGLQWASGVDARLIRWVNLVGMTMALGINATQFIALRETLQARGERLRESEARKGAIMEVALDAIVMMDHLGTIVEFNPAAELLFGYSRDEVTGRVLSDMIVPPDLRDRHVAGLHRYLETGESRILAERIELSAMRKDGSTFPVEISVVRIQGDGPALFTGYLRDLTKQRQEEQGNALWVHSLEQAAFGIVVSDPATKRITRVNPAYARLVGYDQEAIVRMAGEDLIAPSSLTELPSLADALRVRGSYTYGLRLMRSDGATVPVLVASSPVVTSSGTTLLVSTIVDVSEREQLEQERRAAAARLEIVSNAAHEFASASGDVDALLELVARRIAVAIGDGCVVRLISEDRCWLEPSTSFYHRTSELRGSAREILGSNRQRVGEGLAGKVAATGEAVLVPALDPDEIAGLTVAPFQEMLRQLGVTSVLSIPLRSRGRTTGVLSMLRSGPGNAYSVDDQRLAQDLADRAGLAIDNASLVATLEQRVRERTAALEAANSELEAFSYSVSHDLRSPLRAIDGFSRALADDNADRLNEEGLRYLARIRAATQRMGKLIDGLLALARIGRAPLKISDVDVSRIVTEIASELSSREPERRVSIATAPSLTVRADERLVTIALENLLGNAWKFTAKTPGAAIEIGSRDGALFVRDNGVGFDMAYATKLFSPFQRFHAQNEFAGDGIGLATVSRIISHHRGRIWAETAVGAGATFFFTFGDHP